MEWHALRGGGKRLESSPQRGEEAIVSERLASITSAGEGDLDAKRQRSEDTESVTGKMYCHALLSEGEEVAVRVKRVTDTREGLKQNNNYSMPIFEVGTNVVAEDNVRKNIILMFEVGTNVVARGYVRSTPLFHIRNTRYPDSLHSVRPQIRSFLGEVSSTIFENSCNTRYSEAHSQSAEWLQKTRRSARHLHFYILYKLNNFDITIFLRSIFIIVLPEEKSNSNCGNKKDYEKHLRQNRKDFANDK